MAAAAGLLLRGGQRSFPRAAAGAVLAEGIMAGGYFVFESLILGVGAAAAASVPANLLQGAVGALPLLEQGKSQPGRPGQKVGAPRPQKGLRHIQGRGVV